MDVGSRLFVFLLMLIYTIVSYRVFRGKVMTLAGKY
jgi:cytochrome bd-type quinol oxidase subunit 2